MANQKHIKSARRRDEVAEKRNARRETSLALKQFCGSVLYEEGSDFNDQELLQRREEYETPKTYQDLPQNFGGTIGELDLI